MDWVAPKRESTEQAKNWIRLLIGASLIVPTVGYCYYRSDTQLGQEGSLGADKAGAGLQEGEGGRSGGGPARGKAWLAPAAMLFLEAPGPPPSPAPSGFHFLRRRLHASALLPARPAHQRPGPFAWVSRGVKCSAPIKAGEAAGWGLGTCLKGSETLWKEPRSALIPGFALELFNLSFKTPWARLRVWKRKKYT